MLLFVSCLSSSFARATSRPLPSLARTTTLSTVTGSTAMLVRITRPTHLAHDGVNRHIDWLSSTGRYVGFGIEEVAPRRGQALFVVHPLAPCGLRKCPDAQADTSWSSLRGTEEDGPPPTTELEPGIYRIYLLTDPGKRASIRLKLPRLSSAVSLRPTVPVRATYWQRTTAAAAAGVDGEKRTGRLYGRGVVMGMTWNTPINDPAGGFVNYSYALSCIGRGDANDGDALGMCNRILGPPARDDETGLAMGWAGVNAIGRAGLYTYSYKRLAIGAPARFGAYALWLTFVR